jgi:hypothetical protein
MRRPVLPLAEASAGLLRDGRVAAGHDVDDAQIHARRDILRQEHRDLDDAIRALASGTPDQMQMARLKKRKLRLRDEIAMLDDTLVPDIIA